MLKGFTENGEVKNLLVDENGNLKVSMEGGSGSDSTTINNTSENPVPVNVENQNIIVGNTSQNPVPVSLSEEIETTLYSGLEYVGAAADPTYPTTISVNKKVTSIDIANYSEDGYVLTATIGNKSYDIGAGIAVTLPINANVQDVVLSVIPGCPLQAQIIIKGVN